MSFWEFLEVLGRHARVAVAMAPFVVAIVMRLALGENRITRTILSLSTMWFAINVLIAPFSGTLRQQILQLGLRLR